MAHLVTTIAGLENHAQEWLSSRFDIFCYLPRVRVQRVTRGVISSRVEPLFSRYLFILNMTNQWRDVLETRGVLRFLTSGEEPEYVRDREIEMIREREDEEGLIDITPKGEDPDKFKREQRLLVVRGAFAGKIAIHSGLTIGTREFVFFDILGMKQQRFEFEHDMLIEAPPEKKVTKEVTAKRRRRKLRSRKIKPVTISLAA